MNHDAIAELQYLPFRYYECRYWRGGLSASTALGSFEFGETKGIDGVEPVSAGMPARRVLEIRRMIE